MFTIARCLITGKAASNLSGSLGGLGRDATYERNSGSELVELIPLAMPFSLLIASVAGIACFFSTLEPRKNCNGIISNSKTASQAAKRLTSVCHFCKVFSWVLKSWPTTISVEPIKMLKVVDSIDPIKLSCHSAEASFRGNEAKIMEFSEEPTISQPKIARP